MLPDALRLWRRRTAPEPDRISAQEARCARRVASAAPVQPGIAVAGEHDLGVGGGKTIERPAIHVEIGGGGRCHYSRSFASCVGIQGHQRVPAEHDRSVR